MMHLMMLPEGDLLKVDVGVTDKTLCSMNRSVNADGISDGKNLDLDFTRL